MDEKQRINEFLNSDRTIDRYTPSFIKKDRKCAKASIDRDIESVRYLDNIPPRLGKYIINKALKEDYVLHEFSPDFLVCSYEIAKNSINLDVASADFVDWYGMKKLLGETVIDELIDLVIANGYILSVDSSIFLRRNVKVCLNSIKKNFKTSLYLDKCVFKDYEVAKYLLLNGGGPGGDFYKALSFNLIFDKEILSECFKHIRAYGYNGELYKERFDSLFFNALTTLPTIKGLESVFSGVARKDWDYFRMNNAGELENLFAKITSSLRDNDDFEVALNNLSFLNDMENTLEEEYAELYKEMKEYFDIYHSDAEDKLEKMQHAQDKISYYAALYCGKRKDNFIKYEVNVGKKWLKPFFVLRLDNPTVDKQLKQAQKKKKFKELYFNKDESVEIMIDSIVKKYEGELNDNLALQMVFKYVFFDINDLDGIIPKPNNYDAYLRYEKAEKLVKRLNLGYIDFNGVEVKNYKDIIGFDSEKGEYVYTGVVFSQEEKAEIENYKRIGQIFEKIKKDVVLSIRDMDIEVEIDNVVMGRLAEELPFTDEYFEFDKKYLSSFTIDDLWSVILKKLSKKNIIDSLEDDDAFNLLNNTITKYGIIWILLLLLKNSYITLYLNGFNSGNVSDFICNAIEMSRFSKERGFEPKSYKDIIFLEDLGKGADLEAIEMFGLPIVENLCKELSFSSKDVKTIIPKAKRLVAKMAARSMSTVPYISGETDNYKYSIYDSQDETVLVSGIDTYACFKVDGFDNDFFHYCCLDKNGFVIKITDKDGNFIGRAAGFRNGNCVFLNQLRTIYDRCNDYLDGKYAKEVHKIIEALKKACEEIVKTSQENDLERNKIDHVFITRCFLMKHVDIIVSQEISEKIGWVPMDMESQDWKNFIDENRDVLNGAKYNKGFACDYGNNPLICLASTKNPEAMEVDDLRFGDVDALYERTRNKIIATTNIDSNVLRKIKKIKGISSYLNKKMYGGIKVPRGSTVFVGDNWYLVYADGAIVDSCVLEFDEKARRECELIRTKLGKLTDEMIQQKLVKRGK